MPDTTSAPVPEPALRRFLGWLLAPATDEVSRPQAVGATVVRVTLGLLWLYNVSWKVAPSFGKDDDSGLYYFTHFAVTNPVFPPYSWVVEHLIFPVWQPFGWLVLITESLLGVLLVTGTFVRLAGLIGMLQSLAIGLAVAYAPHEWPWSYWLMIIAHLAVMVGAGGRVFAVDAIRARIGRPAVLARSWAVVAAVIGLVSLLASIPHPFAARGYQLHYGQGQVGVGLYNVLGALVLLAIAALLYVGARGSRTAYLVATAVGVVAALLTHIQLVAGSSTLGADQQSAVVWLALALVAWCLATARHDTAP